MKLADHLYYTTRLTPTRFRQMLGGTRITRSGMHRYLRNERIPRPDIMVAITRVTGGAVQLEDFLDPSPPKCARFVIREDGTQRMVLPWSPDWEDAEDLDADPTEPGFEHAQDADELPPVDRALRTLGSRARLTPRGHYLLDGRVTDIRRLIRAANAVLLRTGQPPIRYPGVESSYE